MGEVIVFTKVPEMGRVKTRLQKELSAYVVEELYTAFLTDTLDKLADYEPYIAYYPERKLQMLWTILGDRRYIVQRGANMWERLLKIFGDFYRMKYEYVLAVNCDTPLLKKEHVDEAFASMRDNQVVLGPANDGGFYLIGGCKITPELFEGVVWKSPNVLEAIKENAEKNNLEVGVLEPQRDVDTPEDLKAVWDSGEVDKNGRTYEILTKIHDKLG